MKKIVITGGHHSSALPVIAELRKRYPEIEIYWFGHKYSLKGDTNPTLEYQEIKRLGIPFTNLIAGKFYKTLDPIRLFKIPLGFIHAFFALRKIKPDFILSFGGYLAVPTVIVGKILNIPSVTHEQTIVLGYANKLISKFTDKVLISWPESEKHFKGIKTVYTGLPLRESIFNVQSDVFSVNEKLPIIYITAGKTGSHLINMLVLESLEELLNIANVIHQTGDHSTNKDFDLLTKKYAEIKNSTKGIYNAQKFIFEENIGEAFEKADFVLSRAGAHTCYELLVLDKPSILIPISWVSHNEQYKNAENLKNEGLAEILEEKDLNKELFLSTIKSFINNLDNYHSSKEVIVKNSAKLIVDEIEKTQKKNN